MIVQVEYYVLTLQYKAQLYVLEAFYKTENVAQYKVLQQKCLNIPYYWSVYVQVEIKSIIVFLFPRTNITAKEKAYKVCINIHFMFCYIRWRSPVFC